MAEGIKLDRKPVVVLGMFRSGTSCVAGCFGELGFHMGGDDELYPADAFNPGGYHEIKDLLVLNRRILGAFGMQFFQIEEIPANWEELPGIPGLVRQIESLLREKFTGKGPWGWKEPQTTVLMPLYRKVFGNLSLDPTYVLCVRNPLDVCASQRTHGPLPPIGERVMGLWLHYTLSALRETRGSKRVVFLYEPFLQDPKPFLSRAGALLSESGLPSEAMDRAVATVRPEWRHHDHYLDGLADWPEIVSETYRLAQKCAASPLPFQAGDFDDEVEDLWVKWRKMRVMVRATGIPNGRFLTRWQEGGRTVLDEQPLLPCADWQTVRAPIRAAPGTVLRVDPYQTPCVFWIRRAVVRGDNKEFPADLRSGRSGVVSPESGLLRLVIWGPDPMILHLPNEPVEELELEFLVQSDPNALNEVVGSLRTNLEFLIQKLNQR